MIVWLFKPLMLFNYLLTLLSDISPPSLNNTPLAYTPDRQSAHLQLDPLEGTIQHR